MAAAVFAAKETPEGMIHPGQRKKSQIKESSFPKMYIENFSQSFNRLFALALFSVKNRVCSDAPGDFVGIKWLSQRSSLKIVPPCRSFRTLNLYSVTYPDLMGWHGGSYAADENWPGSTARMIDAI